MNSASSKLLIQCCTRQLYCRYGDLIKHFNVWFWIKCLIYKNQILVNIFITYVYSYVHQDIHLIYSFSRIGCDRRCMKTWHSPSPDTWSQLGILVHFLFRNSCSSGHFYDSYCLFKLRDWITDGYLFEVYRKRRRYHQFCVVIRTGMLTHVPLCTQYRSGNNAALPMCVSILLAVTVYLLRDLSRVLVIKPSKMSFPLNNLWSCLC